MKIPFRRPMAMAALLGQVGIVACSADARQPVAPRAEAPRAALGGEAVFRGLFFGSGAGAALFAEVWHGRSAVERAPDAKTAALLRAIENDAVARIRAGDPAFFNRFGAAVHTGDRVQIDAALQDAATRLDAALHQNIDYTQLHGPSRSRYVSVETVVAAVLVLLIVIIDIVPDRLPGDTPQLSGSVLKREQLVDLIARRAGPGAHAL